MHPRPALSNENDAMADGAEPVFALVRPAVLSTPFVFSSPHSGRFYPAEMMAASHLDSRAIRQSEDAYVDELIAPAVALGAPVIAACYARAYVDVNREPYELDPAMFEDQLPAFAAARTARVAAGLGSIARVVAEGQEIYRRKLTFEEAQARIEQVHRPYHRALKALVDEVKARFGRAILVDWHSMPSGAANIRHGDAPDIVLGDRFGAACARPVIDAFDRAFSRAGYRVARNAPYAGGYTTEFYGCPSQGVHALQIELSRALYLDEATLEASSGRDRLAADIESVTKEVIHMDWSRLA